MIFHCPANDLAGKDIEHQRQIQPPVRRVNVSEVGYPLLIRTVGAEIPLQAVRRDGKRMATVRRLDPTLATMLGDQVMFPLTSSNRIASCLHTASYFRFCVAMPNTPFR